MSEIEQPDAEPARRRGTRGLTGRHVDAARLLLIIGLILVLGDHAQSQNDPFVTTQGIFNILFLAVPVALLAAAEFVVLFVGGIDISVGAAMAVCVVVLSFLVNDPAFLPALLISLVVAVGAGVVAEIVNATLVQGVKISPVVATIARLGILRVSAW